MKAIPLTKIIFKPKPRLRSGICGFDQVLGGGIVADSAILLAGSPGAGKSSLMLQVVHALACRSHKVLYVSGEESMEQLKDRATRLKALHSSIWCSENIKLEDLFSVIKSTDPELIVVDSLQMLHSDNCRGVIGGPSQNRYCLTKLVELTKKEKRALVLIGHSTKTGLIAGLLTLQHIVDTTLFLRILEDDTRELIATKNRFGDNKITWNVEMTDSGLKTIHQESTTIKIGFNELQQIVGDSFWSRFYLEGFSKLVLEKFAPLKRLIKYDILLTVDKEADDR